MKYITTLTLLGSIVAAQSINLDTVVVSATKSEQNIKDVTSNVTVITKEELEDKHITTVAEALKEAQGVIVSQNGGMGQTASVYVRGFSNEYTLVLIDGIKVNDPTTPKGSAQIGYLTLNDIDRIEIVKGAQSGIYGANAAAGVINIITKKSDKDCLGNINLEYGKYNTKIAQVSLSKKVGNLSAHLSYSRVKTDGFTAQADIKNDIDDYEDDSYENRSFNIGFDYHFTKNDKISLEYIKTDATTQYDGYPITNQLGYVSTYDSKFYKFSYIHKYSNNSYSKIYYTKSKIERHYSNTTPPYDHYKGENSEYGIDNKVSFKNFDILFGFNKQEQKNLINNDSFDSKGAYITANVKYNNTSLTATLRRDFYDTFDDKTTGKIGFKHFFDNGLILSSNYGTAYRIPSLFEYQNRLDNSLKPETIKSFDIGFEYKNFTFTYFKNDIEDMIDYQLSPTWQVQYYNSNNESTIKGFEIGYKGTITDDLIFGIDYTRYMARDSDGNQLPKKPSYIINASLDYYGFQNTHINLNAQYIGKRYDFDWSTYPATKVQTGKFFVANMAIDYKINDNVTAYLKIDNITDKKYQDVYGYATSGRAVYVGVNAKF